MHIPAVVPLYSPNFDIALVNDAAGRFNEGMKQSNLLSLVSGDYPKLEGVYLIEQKIYWMMTGLPLDYSDDDGTPVEDIPEGTDPLARNRPETEYVERDRRQPTPHPSEHEERERPNIPENDVPRVNSRSGRGGVICLAGVYVRKAAAFAAQAGIHDDRIQTGPGIFLCPPVIGIMTMSMQQRARLFPKDSRAFKVILRLTFWHELGHHLFPFFTSGLEGYAEAFANLTAYEVAKAHPNRYLLYRRWLFEKTTLLQPAEYSGYRVLLANQRGLDKFAGGRYPSPNVQHQVLAIDHWKNANRLPSTAYEERLRSVQDYPALRAYGRLMGEPATKPHTVRIDVIERQLFQNNVSQKISNDYGLSGTYSDPHQFAQAFLTALGQTPVGNPIAISYTNNDVFEAAVRALGSNARKWSSFLANEPALRRTLQNYDPGMVIASGVSPVSLMPFLPGQTAPNDSHAIIVWAHLLNRVPDYYQTVIVPVTRMFQHLDPSLTTPELLLCMVGFFGSDPAFIIGNLNPAPTVPPSLQTNSWFGRWNYTNAAGKHITRNLISKKWKFPGMRYALGSEFLRNLRWNGFKVDRHIKRLFTHWQLAEPIAAKRAGQLGAIFGVHIPTDLKEYLYCSLQGMAISPSGVWFSHVDNLVWALGAYVEKKGRESNIQYVR